MVLDRLLQERGQIFNQTVRKPNAPQKCSRERAGILQGLEVNDSWSSMNAAV
jgi:hypothetical protein